MLPSFASIRIVLRNARPVYIQVFKGRAPCVSVALDERGAGSLQGLANFGKARNFLVYIGAKKGWFRPS